MTNLVSILLILTVVLVHLSPAQDSAPLSKSHSKVMLFHEAWARSVCRSLERMVQVEQEYPGGVEHIFSPGCVPLQRCSGCCSDEKLECYPTRTQNVTIQLLRITPAERTREYVLLSFLEHHTCECRPRRGHLKDLNKKRVRYRHRRRRGRKRSTNCIKCRQPHI